MTLISADREERWPELAKEEVARRLADRIAQALREPPSAGLTSSLGRWLRDEWVLRLAPHTDRVQRDATGATLGLAAAAMIPAACLEP